MHCGRTPWTGMDSAGTCTSSSLTGARAANDIATTRAQVHYAVEQAMKSCCARFATVPPAFDLTDENGWAVLHGAVATGNQQPW